MDLGHFRAARRHAVGKQAAVVRRDEVVDRVRLPGFPADRLRVDEQLLGTVEALAHVELELVVGRAALLVEIQVARAALHIDHARSDGIVESADPLRQSAAAGNPIEDGACVVRLRAHPAADLGIVAVFEVTERILQRHAEVGVLHRPRRCRRRRLDGQGNQRQGANRRSEEALEHRQSSRSGRQLSAASGSARSCSRRGR
jgi:hypothetical protein